MVKLIVSQHAELYDLRLMNEVGYCVRLDVSFADVELAEVRWESGLQIRVNTVEELFATQRDIASIAIEALSKLVNPQI